MMDYGHDPYDHEFDYGDDYPEEPDPKFKTYRCGGWASYSGPCGALDCEDCHPGGARAMWEEEQSRTAGVAETIKYVVARKPRFVGTTSEIRPGDTVQVKTGFTFKPNGPRTGYLPRRYFRHTKGPAWEDDDRGEKGRW